jgi:uncharacterized membrane protein YbhN (UPF0104 family)
MAYIGLAAPSTAARVAVNIRFFQRHGLGAGTAIAIGALDAFTGIAVQALLVLGLLALTGGSLDVSLTHDAPGNIGLLAIVVGFVAVLAIAVLLSVARWRRVILDRARVLAADALTVARGLGSRRRLGLLLGGILVTEVLLAIALGVFAASLGYRIDLSGLLLISTSVALLATILPVPGGIGVIEGGLTYGLVGAGMPEETAFAAVLMYRLATFYIPPVWGFFALRWLERRRHL